MIRIKAPKAAPDFKSSSRHANGRIFDICVRWRNAEGGLKDKQMGVFIWIMGLSWVEERNPTVDGLYEFIHVGFLCAQPNLPRRKSGAALGDLILIMGVRICMY